MANDPTRIFLSWSGDRSRRVAEALRDWLPDVLGELVCFHSDDIEAGARWPQEIAKQLETLRYGVLCLTPENNDPPSPWLLFEAGALSKTLDDSRVCPYLLGLEPGHLKGPLVQFQAKRATKDDTRDLVGTMNDIQDGPNLAPERLERRFEKFWPDLEKRLAAIPTATALKPARPDLQEMTEEILEILRRQERRQGEGARQGENEAAPRASVRPAGPIADPAGLFPRFTAWDAAMALANRLDANLPLLQEAAKQQDDLRRKLEILYSPSMQKAIREAQKTAADLRPIERPVVRPASAPEVVPKAPKPEATKK